MIFKTIAEVEPGAVISRPVMSSDGRVLLKPGTKLTESYLGMLHRRGIQGVHLLVDVAGGSGTMIPTIVSEQLRTEAAGTVGKIQGAGHAILFRVGPVGPEDLAKWLGSAEGERALLRIPPSELGVVAQGIVDQVLNAAADANLRLEKSLHEYSAKHGVDTAIVAVTIARRLGVGREEMVALARGCMLMDVGMSFVGPKIVNKAGPLTADERTQIELHPRLGYELLRGLQPEAVAANAIALHHHEREDGSGYPQALRGGSRLSKGGARDTGRGEIAGLAQIAAVADVYDALSSDRPHRPACAPDQVRAMMKGMAPTKLNTEIVDALLDALPLFPLGGRVTLICRQYPRHRGLVVRRNRQSPDRPVIRIYGDADGKPIEPVEIDLTQERGILVKAAV